MLWRDEAEQVMDERRDVYNVPVGIAADVARIFKAYGIPDAEALADILSISYATNNEATPLWWRSFKSSYSAKFNLSGNVIWSVAGWIEKIGVLVSEVFFALGWKSWARKRKLKALL